MKKTWVVTIACMMIVTALIPMVNALNVVTTNRCINASDASNDEPVFEDRIRDVRLFGLWRVIPQFSLKYLDIQSAWFFEKASEPDYLYVSLQVRDLQDNTELLEAIYTVHWSFNYHHYVTVVHANPQGVGTFVVGRSTDDQDDIEEWNVCEGSFDVTDNLITWKVAKSLIDNPPPLSTLMNILPSTHARFTDDSGLPLIDLFKDLPWNAKTTNDYTIEY